MANPNTHWQRTVMIMFLAQLVTAIGFSSIFPFLPLYVLKLGSSTGLNVELLTGLVFSAQAFTMMIASPVWGALADHFSRKLMVERAMFGGSLVLMTMSSVRSAEQLVFLRAVQGLVTGTIGASNALVAATVPRERIGYAMGLLQTAMGIGVAVGPPLGGIIGDIYGYPAVFRVTSILLFVSGLMVWIGVEEKDDKRGHEAFQGIDIIGRWRRVLRGPGVLITYGIRFLNQSSRMVFLPVLPLLVQQILAKDVPLNTFTGLIVGAGSATATLSAAWLGYLGDRTDHRSILIGCCFISFLLYLMQGSVTTGWQLLFLQALAGLFLGGILPAITALLAHLTEGGEEGAVYGLDNAISSGARMIAPVIGVKAAHLFGLRSVFIISAFFYLTAGILGTWNFYGSKPRE